MTTRRIDRLITRIRRDTGNIDYSSTSGIPQRDIAEYLTDAQTNIQLAIAKQHRSAFVKESFLNTVANQEAYDLPYDALFEASPRTVEYASTGQLQDYYLLEKRELLERQTRYAGEPWFYFRRNKQILLNPRPQRSVTSGVRLQYPQRLPTLFPPAGQIIVSYDTPSRTIDALTLDPSGTYFFPEYLTEDDFVSIVAADGTPVVTSIPIYAIDLNTGVIDIGSNHQIRATESAPTGGQFLVPGYWASTHSLLEPTVEPYLIAYGVWKVQKRDSNDDSSEQTPELLAMLDQIVDAYADLTQDVDRVTVLTDWEI